MQFHRILIPIDFSLGSAHALDYGAELATHFDASLTVLHAYQLPSFALPDGAIMATPGLVTRITDHAAEAMESFVEPLGETDIKVEALLREGEASTVIAQVATEIDASVILMGTHDGDALVHLLSGSVTERVVRGSRVPVLTVHESLLESMSRGELSLPPAST